MLAEHITPSIPVWQHDRSLTVGASEIGQCARRTWYTKKGYLPEFTPNWGFGERGHAIEDWVYRRLRAAGIRLRWKQRTLVDGYLSATLDGMHGRTVIDIKSFDPRKRDPVEHRHRVQVQAQIGLADARDGLLLYVNASDFQDLREVPIERDDATYRALQDRARRIMVVTDPPLREGVIKGGDECRYCVFQTACVGRPIKGDGDLSNEAVRAIEGARDAIRRAEVWADGCSEEIAREKERIREILRAANACRAPGLARIARSQRTSLDQAAMRADGVDVDKYRVPGREIETVTVE